MEEALKRISVERQYGKNVSKHKQAGNRELQKKWEDLLKPVLGLKAALGWE
jgi:hypothetical protein